MVAVDNTIIEFSITFITNIIFESLRLIAGIYILSSIFLKILNII